LKGVDIIKTLAETIREQLTPREICMAVAAINGAISAMKARDNKYGHDNIRFYKSGYGQASGSMAFDVLYNIFEGSPDCRAALQKMADDNFGVYGEKIPVFDRFIEELNNLYYKEWGDELKVRKVETIEILN